LVESCGVHDEGKGREGKGREKGRGRGKCELKRLGFVGIDARWMVDGGLVDCTVSHD